MRIQPFKRRHSRAVWSSASRALGRTAPRGWRGESGNPLPLTLMDPRFRGGNIRAFTLTELVMVIVLIGILGGLSAVYVLMMTDTLGLVTKQADLQESASLALSRISREVRRLKNDQSVMAPTNSTRITFVDITGDQISYYLSGGAIVRDQGPPGPLVTNELADKATAFSVKYYDDAGADITGSIVLAPRTNIRRIEFLITLQDGTRTLNAQTTVRPRNFRHESDFFF